LEKAPVIDQSIIKLSQREPLEEAEAYACMIEILEGKASPVQISSYLSFLTFKGENTQEVVGSFKAMREKMVRVDANGLDAIDICGTGGDHKGTFNISTAAALVLAGGGVTVAKHGNRAASSQCGSAEVLDTLGVKIDPATRVVENCLREAKIAFLFAPHFHPAMKNVGPIRKELRIRTIFNILGPMCNPAGVKRQVIGVFNNDKAKLVAEALTNSGKESSERIIALHSEDGLDEVSCAVPTVLHERYFEQATDHKKRDTIKIKPEDFGFNRHDLETLKGADAATNAKIVMEILKGEKGPRREAVVMNAAVGFFVAGKCKAIKDGGTLAEESIDSGKALKALQTLEKVSHQ
jgi:anthranilate phosphoribosyltransferase